MLGHGYISYSEYALSSTLPISITLIAIVLSEYIMLLSYATVNFYLLYDGADMIPSNKKSV